MNRKQRREADKKGEKPAIEEKLMLFGKLPDKCLGCAKPFDKKDKEQVSTWTVMVYNSTETVKLYCPQCRNDIQAWAEDIANEKP
jgi:hypothetical protein